MSFVWKEVCQEMRFKDAFKEEGDTAYFEAQLFPKGDSTMKIEWLKDGEPVPESKWNDIQEEIHREKIFYFIFPSKWHQHSFRLKVKNCTFVWNGHFRN